MRHVDLCSGIGGFALGFQWAGLSKPVLFCDIEPWSRELLAKHWPDVPIAEDVKELASDPDGLIPDCDILTAGYPCQPFSLAGKRGGEEDPRHIWPYILQIVASKRPTWCVFENVYGHLTLGLDQVLLDLEAEGYATRTFIVPACSVDAPHKRDRIWIIAKNVADTNSTRREEQRWPQPAQPEHQAPQCGGGWLTEPAVGRVANGIPKRVDRLKGIGNAVVPYIPYIIGKRLKELCQENQAEKH